MSELVEPLVQTWYDVVQDLSIIGPILPRLSNFSKCQCGRQGVYRHWRVTKSIEKKSTSKEKRNKIYNQIEETLFEFRAAIAEDKKRKKWSFNHEWPNCQNQFRGRRNSCRKLFLLLQKEDRSRKKFKITWVKNLRRSNRDRSMTTRRSQARGIWQRLS